ncbi:hypothetical protein MNBD_GAMMA08-254, partial [hydrothermal vent metagenome]
YLWIEINKMFHVGLKDYAPFVLFRYNATRVKNLLIS